MLRVGILGAGHFAKAHCRAIARLAGRVEAVCVARRDLDKGFEYDVPVMAPDELVVSPDVDAVAVCLPNHLHREYSERALRAGKHVFCEKPMALTIEDADALLDVAGKTDRVFLVGHLARFVPAYATVSAILESGRLGAPRNAYVSRLHVGSGRSWRMDPAIGGGVVFDLLIHDIDLLTWYLGRPTAVVARGQRHFQGTYAHLAAIFTYDGGAVAVAEGSFTLPRGSGLRAFLRIVCENGYVEVDPSDTETTVRVRAAGEEEERLAQATPDVLIDGLVGEYEEFLSTVAGAAPQRLRPEDARLAVECAVLATRAADTGEAVAFP